ncbi:uncharacterized protein LOC135924464 [Gordionus sp. m RMFG-2023]|uniref:uncharacterized protein LOC135924464 n=1 Tax=Gordionus sp. m RMFG-2023 TaxID=3053472 RepID=UPI0031FDA86C
MVFPRSLKESLRNGKMSKRNCSLTLVVVAYDQRSNQTEERNITYIISYKTPQMNRPNGKYIIHQKTRSKRPRDIPKANFENLEEFLQGIEELNPAAIEDFLQLIQDIGANDAVGLWAMYFLS